MINPIDMRSSHHLRSTQEHTIEHMVGNKCAAVGFVYRIAKSVLHFRAAGCRRPICPPPGISPRIVLPSIKILQLVCVKVPKIVQRLLQIFGEYFILKALHNQSLRSISSGKIFIWPILRLISLVNELMTLYL